MGDKICDGFTGQCDIDNSDKPALHASESTGR